MSIEGVDSENTNTEYYCSYERNHSKDWNGRSVTAENTASSNISDMIVPCGERCRGEASYHAMIDKEGNKEAGVELKIEDEEEKSSASVKVDANEDSEGNFNARFEIKGTMSF